MNSNSGSHVNSPPGEGNRPDYDGLIRFLIEPLLESPELLCFDCELVPSTRKVWIRLAIEDEDKGRIYGRGGRNIQAVKTILQTAAQLAGDTLYLELYEDNDGSRKRIPRPSIVHSPPPKAPSSAHPKKSLRRRRRTPKSRF
ncbi:MAG: KH domain-containing protein [Geminocystis sp.]|nr:KH domain-containing protein [Geminocystis sp.]